MAGERYAAAALRGWREVTGVAPGQRDAAAWAPAAEPHGGGSALGLELANGTAELSIASDGTLRLRAAAGAVLPTLPENAVERGPWEPAAANPREAADGEIAFASSHAALHVRVQREPLAIRWIDRRGARLAELCELSLGAEGGARISLAIAPGDRCCGFGDDPLGLDKRGRQLQLRNPSPQSWGRAHAQRFSIPFFLIHRGATRSGGCCGVLLDTFGAARFDVARSRGDRIQIESASGGLDLMLFPGPRPADVMARYTRRVGRAPLPPLWALGHQQSARSLRGDRAIRALSTGMRRHGVPTTALHLRDPREAAAGAAGASLRERLISDLRGQGLRCVCAVNAGVSADPACTLYREGCAREVFCRREDGCTFTLPTRRGQRALPDFNRADTRAWWAERLAPVFRDGAAGIADAWDPISGWRSRALAIGRAVSTRGKAKATFLQADPADPKRCTPCEPACNLYGLQQARASHAASETLAREQRPFVVTHSGTTGVQRHAAVLANPGASGWARLRAAIPTLLGLSLAGATFCGIETAVGLRRCSAELFARWIQLASLFPLACTEHALILRRGGRPRFGRRVRRIAHEAIALRTRLLPEIYQRFREAEETGAPPWRPLFFEFPDDPVAAGIDDAFLLGTCLLVAPVLERGVRERRVYLPAGHWTSWHDGARYTGPRWMAVSAPLERLPLFVRAGSVISLRDAARGGAGRQAAACVLAVYPGADAAAALVEDDGETTAYRGGATARTSLRLWQRAGGRLRLELGRREGAFPIPDRALHVHIHGCPPPTAVYLDGARLAARESAPGWVAQDGSVIVRLLDRGAGASIEIDPAP
ncbi:MAG: glycoside hydrolase family 31 protein [Myxococcales bacterium]|nr:glycoside hydrolase family 31 protein [Myxococcales bacterium]MDH5305894.1 glycoside hydrolase family 31 protein [Myxococcales bacterium]MDH5566695.1 glycoside hydrolase family 31 protein [Myxococcales bacterium]